MATFLQAILHGPEIGSAEKADAADTKQEEKRIYDTRKEKETQSKKYFYLS